PPIPPRPPGYELKTLANPPLPARPSKQKLQQQQSYLPPPPPSPAQHPQSQQSTFNQLPQWQPQNPLSNASQPSQWTPLFHPDGTPTPLFEALTADIWKHLDSGRTGHITPEVFSAFLDVQGFLLENNTWKANHKPNTLGMYTAEDIADFKLKAACEAWSFDHTVVVRSPGRPQLPYGGMPLLSLRGLTDMMAVEYAADPDQSTQWLNAALRYYGVWPALVPLPRDALLRARPAEVQDRIDKASVRSQRTASESMEATRVRNEIAAQGRRNALELL
ncbi:uncharacterized protein BCR38DRAFT_322464, partial [Pseudomassariella vexata]